MSSVGTTSSGPTIAIRPGRSTSSWGLIGLVVTESVLFALLLFVYFYYRAHEGAWPPEELPLPELPKTIVRTAVLLGSTVPMILAERAMERRGSAAWTAVWSIVALAMAGYFLGTHVHEQPKLVDELRPDEHTYGAVLITILNFHGVHLLVGIVMLAFVLVHVWRGRVTRERHTMLSLTGVYWHFVDAIWVVVFSSLYLVPNVLGRT
ncbi:MAG: cytochrome c oxidase subunit 3 [Actinobacteria bacterium]|nr:cytochrome c oxidase subunit 3 [Actinomycetota bacterium]